MKEKIQKGAQTFSRAIIQPVMFMAVSGLIISIAAVLKLEFMPGVIKEFGNGIFTVITNGAISQLSVIFCVGIAAAMAKKKKTDAAILGITTFMIFLFANNYWLDFTGRLAEPGEQGLFGTGQNLVLGIQVTDMGVFLGIALGIMVGYFVNRFGDIKFHKYLSPYEGTKFAYVLIIAATIIAAILVTYIWPPINAGVNSAVSTMSGMGSVGFFLYGFLNRMLLPFGMHHLLWMPLYYTPLGGTAEIAGQSYNGAMNIWLAQVGNIGEINTIHESIGYLVNFGYIALPIGIALAFIKTALPENKQKVKAIVIPAVFAAAFAGITEPLEFLFLFISPILWFAHAIVYGFGLFISNVLGLQLFVENVINTTMYALSVPMALANTWLLIPIGLGLAILEYFVFKTMIIKLNIPTIGRQKMEEAKEKINGLKKKISPTSTGTNSIVERNEQLDLIIEGLGGVENIENIYNCFTRLRLDVYDDSKVNLSRLKEYPSSGVVDKQKHIQIVIGLGVEGVKDALQEYVEDVKQGKVNNQTIAETTTGTAHQI